MLYSKIEESDKYNLATQYPDTLSIFDVSVS